MKLKIAVNKSCKNKTNPQKVAKGWLNITEDIHWLEGWVKPVMAGVLLGLQTSIV